MFGGWANAAPPLLSVRPPRPTARPPPTEEANRDGYANSSPPRGAFAWVAPPREPRRRAESASPTLAQVLAEGFVAPPRTAAGAVGERSDAPPQPLSRPPPSNASGPPGAQHAGGTVVDEEDASLLPALLTPAVVLHMGRGWAGYPPGARAAV